MRKIKQLVKRIVDRNTFSKNGSTYVNDPPVIDAFIANPSNTFLVSFPRTGSHWLRMVMELYFERPSLVRIFYYPEKSDYLTLHTHDLELDVERLNVIYLYRDPVDTIYSQLRYHKEDTNNKERITYWTDLYGRHLDKWLNKETFTRKKAIILYENISKNLINEFEKICSHFDYPLNIDRLREVATQVTKEEVKQKTKHDSQVMNLSESYSNNKNYFCEEYDNFIWQILLNNRNHLKRYF